MRKTTYIKKMREHDLRIAKVWKKIVADTNKFVAKNPDVNFYSMTTEQHTPEHLANSLIFKGVWLFERIDDDTKLKKKIRKVMGYSYP